MHIFLAAATLMFAMQLGDTKYLLVEVEGAQGMSSHNYRIIVILNYYFLVPTCFINQVYFTYFSSWSSCEIEPIGTSM